MLLCYRFVFEYQVEKEKVKQEMLGKWFGHDSSCLFGDITKMCENELRDDILLDPKKVKWKLARIKIGTKIDIFFILPNLVFFS